MKELRIEDFSPFSEVEAKIWEIFDLIRNQIPSQEYDVLLLILSGFKDRLFSSDLLTESTNIKEGIIGSFYNSASEQQAQYLKIIDCFRPSLGMIKKDTYKDILTRLEEIDKEILIENYSELFDDIIYRLALSQGKLGGEFIQPAELTRLMSGLADLNKDLIKDTKIFNPFAGLGSFGVNLNEGQEYFGQELNKRTWALGTLRIMAYEGTGNIKYVCDDSITHWPDESEKFDLIYTNPPIGLRLGQQFNSKTIEEFIIENSVRSLNENGKLIALIPQGFLFRNTHEKRLREYLLEEDLIDTIISLPGGLLLNTGIPLVIIVINKNKKAPGTVRFVDAKEYVTENGLKRKKLNDYGLNSFIHSGNNNEEVVRIVENKEIRENDYNLTVARFFQKKIEGTKLSQLINLIRGTRGTFPKMGKIVKIKDLKNDKFEYQLDVVKVENEELNSKIKYHLISESCLLLAVRWENLKPTLFEFIGEPIYISNDILPFKINEHLVDKTFLIHELHAKYVQEQLSSFRLSGVIPSLHKDDILEIVIKLPSIEEQKAKVEAIYELDDQIKRIQAERNALLHGSSINKYNEFASLKHTLGRPRQNILDWTDNLLDFLSKKPEGFEGLNESFANFYEIDILSVLKEIKNDINFMTSVLEKGENGFILSQFEKRMIPLSELNSIISDLSHNNFKFKIKKLLLEGAKTKERGINANSILLKTLLDNILTNANKYGFDSFSIGNEVVIELTEVDDVLSIEIRNNGKPFPKNFNKERFITKYSTADSTSGKGIGGYDINRIAAYFNNPDWILSLNEDPLYPVKFKFQFSISLID